MSDERYRLITPPDPGWVVLPAYACRDVARAQEIISRVPLDDAGTPVKIVDSRTNEVLLSRPGANGFDARSIVYGPRHAWDDRSHAWDRRQHLGQHSPSSHALLLMKPGKGQYVPRVKRDDLEAAAYWLRPIVRHAVDCYVEWETQNGRPLREFRTVHRPRLGSPVSVDFLTGSNARGVLYSRSYGYDPDTGEPTTVIVRLVLITAAVYSRGSPSCHIHFERYASAVSVAADGSFEEPQEEFIEPCWFPLIETARLGFATHCAVEQPGCRARRRFLFEQIDKEDADAELNGTGFRGKAMKMAWSDALTLVNEPWQLGVVADVHGEAFVTAPQQTYQEAVEAMLASYACSEERRAQLSKMKDEYLALASDGWTKPFKDAFLS